MIKLSEDEIYAPRQYDLGKINMESAGLTSGARHFANDEPELYQTLLLELIAEPVGELPVWNL